MHIMPSVSPKNDLVEIQTLIPNLLKDIRYATANNFTGKVIYSRPDCYLRKSSANKLLKVHNELEQLGLGLVIFDGYRPLSVQKKLWDVFPDERYVANPAFGSKHNRGTAVDVTIRDLRTGTYITMPSEYDDFTERAHRAYEKMSHEAAINCKLLELLMEKHGFLGLPTEWWHFDDTNWQNFDILDTSFEELAESARTIKTT